jgi:DNA-binding NarL/FixJ family response regulator
VTSTATTAQALQLITQLVSDAARDSAHLPAALGALKLLTDAAAERADAVAADDTHWLEDASAEVITFVARRTDHGGTAPRLSPQELQIAVLAAQGLTNREIGGRLRLSHRTVGSHLYRMFPKLGIRSRAQLHGAVRAALPAYTPEERSWTWN